MPEPGTSSDPLVGRQIAQFVVLEPLAAGGMGVVYRARDETLKREVALKVLPAATAADDTTRARFLREAQSLAAVNHPNIASIFAAGESDGVAFIAMELIGGESLREVLATGAMPTERALDIATGAARALAAAHERNIVHRDLKPGNIVLDEAGEPKLLDFGLAKPCPILASELAETEAAGELQHLTTEGIVLGTPAYMSPEQTRGVEVDGRGDIFSFGIVLYEMLAGRLPFVGKTAMDTVIAIARDDPTPLRELVPAVPEAVARVVERCLHKAPEERYQTAADLAADLADAREALGDDAGPVESSVSERRAIESSPTELSPALAPTEASEIASPIASSSTGGRRWWWVAVAALVAAGAALGAWRVWGGSDGGVERGGTLRVAISVARGDAGSQGGIVTLSRLVLVRQLVIERLSASAGDEHLVEVRARGNELELELRDGVWFHEHPCLGGAREATSADLVASIRRSPKVFAFAGDAEVAVVDVPPRGARVRGRYPFTEPRSLLHLADLRPADEACASERYRSWPVGSGPFALAVEPDVDPITLVRHARYWGSSTSEPIPRVDRIELYGSRDPVAALGQLGRGELDLLIPRALEWPALFELGGERPRLKREAPGVRVVHSTLGAKYGMVGLAVSRAADSAVRDRRVRAAIALAIDRDAIAQSSASAERALGRFLELLHVGHEPGVQAIVRDVAKARALVAETGLGARLAIGAIATYRESAELLAEQLREVGFDARVVAVSRANAGAALAKGTVDVLFGRYTTHMASDDPLPPLVRIADGELLSSETARLLHELRSEADINRRRPLYADLERGLIRDLPLIPIATIDREHPRAIYVVGPRVELTDRTELLEGVNWALRATVRRPK